MDQQPAAPVCIAFILCRQVFEDARTHDHIILGPTVSHRAFEYPSVANLAVFSQWTSAHGAYHPEVRLQDLGGQTIWRQIYSPPTVISNPLDVRAIIINDCRLVFPAPGKYDILLLANEHELIRTVFWAHVQKPRQ